MAEIEIEIHHAMTGEVEFCFTMLAGETLKTLDQRVRAHVDKGEPQLLLDGQPLDLRKTMTEAGIVPPKVILQMIRHRSPAECGAAGWFSLEGYHVHDSFLRQVPSLNQRGAFTIVWQRGYAECAGSYRAHIQAIRQQKQLDGPRIGEYAVLDVSKENDRGRGGLMLFRKPVHSRCPLLMAIVDGKGLMNVPSKSSHAPSGGATAELVLVPANVEDVTGHVLWRQEDDEELQKVFQGQLQLFTMYVANDQRIYAVGVQCDDRGVRDDCSIILRCDLDLERGKLSFADWAEAEGLRVHCPWGFAGSDKDGKRLYFYKHSQSRDHHGSCSQLMLTVMSAEPLGDQRKVLLPPFDFENSEGETKWCVIDPITEDLYFFYDRSLEHADESDVFRADAEDRSSDGDDLACSIYRLRNGASVDDPELVRRYEASSYDLICHAPLQIDSFSDSFCVALAGYDSKTDTIVILDAGEQLWRLPMNKARCQDPLER